MKKINNPVLGKYVTTNRCSVAMLVTIMAVVSLLLMVVSMDTVKASEKDKSVKEKNIPESTLQAEQAKKLKDFLSSKSSDSKEFGIKPIGIKLTATDYMLDFRYKVVDRDKAARIINRKVQPYLIIEKTGTMLKVPESPNVGALRQTAQFAKEGRNYFMLFVNPGRVVKSGDKVTIVAGDYKLEHLTVN